MFAGNFAPVGWAYCDGQLMAVANNDALFSLLGTIYGGDGRTTFGLPDMRGRIPVHAGSGPGLSTRPPGAQGGSENVTVTSPQLPSHNHTTGATATTAGSGDPAGRVPANTTPTNIYATAVATSATLASSAVSSAGGSASHTNLMPYLCVHFIIALFGIYPSRH
jgi:microcystin-dependent protein